MRADPVQAWSHCLEIAPSQSSAVITTMLTALGWELEIALYLFTLQLHATLNALQEHGDHPAINWSLLPGQEKAGDSHWVVSSAAWFLNGPGGHLVTSPAGPGLSCPACWRKERTFRSGMSQIAVDSERGLAIQDPPWAEPRPACLLQVLSKHLVIPLFTSFLEFLNHHPTSLWIKCFLPCLSSKYLHLPLKSGQTSPLWASIFWKEVV